jgi:hypothetical protein
MRAARSSRLTIDRVTGAVLVVVGLLAPLILTQ